MKNKLLIVMLMIPLLSFTQKSNITEIKKPNLRLEMLGGSYGGYSNVRMGPVMMLGGTSLFITALLSVPMNQWRGVPQSSPYVKDTPRFMSMVGGITVFSFGTIISLTGN